MQSFMSPLAVLAFAVGTSVGWGSLIVTSNTYLKQAGPWGSVLGLIIGAAIMLLVCWNYHFLAFWDSTLSFPRYSLILPIM